MSTQENKENEIELLSTNLKTLTETVQGLKSSYNNLNKLMNKICGHVGEHEVQVSANAKNIGRIIKTLGILKLAAKEFSEVDDLDSEIPEATSSSSKNPAKPVPLSKSLSKKVYFNCNICDRKFPFKRQLLSHEATHNNNNKSNNFPRGTRSSARNAGKILQDSSDSNGEEEKDNNNKKKTTSEFRKTNIRTRSTEQPVRKISLKFSKSPKHEENQNPESRTQVVSLETEEINSYDDSINFLTDNSPLSRRIKNEEAAENANNNLKDDVDSANFPMDLPSKEDTDLMDTDFSFDPGVPEVSISGGDDDDDALSFGSSAGGGDFNENDNNSGSNLKQKHKFPAKPTAATGVVDQKASASEENANKNLNRKKPAGSHKIKKVRAICSLRCPKCPLLQFSRLDTWKRHLKNKHPTLPIPRNVTYRTTIQCYICQNTFSRKSHLTVHLAKMHGGNAQASQGKTVEDSSQDQDLADLAFGIHTE